MGSNKKSLEPLSTPRFLFSLFFSKQGLCPRDCQSAHPRTLPRVERSRAKAPKASKCSCDFLDLKELQLVPFIDVVVALDVQAAFKVFLDLFGIVFEAL